MGPCSVIITLDQSCLNPGQRKFLASRAPNVLFCGGFGSGKSVALVLKMLQLKSANPGVAGLLIAQTYGALEAVLVAALFGLYRENNVPEHLWPRYLGKGTGKDRLNFGDGVPVHLRSADTPKGMDGLSVGWVCGDEIRYYSKMAYDVAIGRRREKCPLPQSAFASTPAFNWMYEEFCSDRPNREIIMAPTKENERNLTPGFIDNLRHSYSPRMQRAVLDGQFTMVEGSVFPEFDPNPDTSPWIIDAVPDAFAIRKCRIFLAVDPGYRRSSWIWIAKTGELEWLVFDQAQLDDHSDESAARIINDRGWAIDEIWLDPAARAVQSGAGMDTLRILRGAIKTRQSKDRYGRAVGAFRTVDRYRDIRFGVEKLRVLLGGYEGAPRRIRFTRQLALAEKGRPRGIVKGLAALRYPEAKEGKPISDLPIKDGIHDHAVDSLRYFAVGRWLCEPELRRVDPTIKDDAPGYKVHLA